MATLFCAREGARRSYLSLWHPAHGDVRHGRGRVWLGSSHLYHLLVSMLSRLSKNSHSARVQHIGAHWERAQTLRYVFCMFLHPFPQEVFSMYQTVFGLQYTTFLLIFPAPSICHRSIWRRDATGRLAVGPDIGVSKHKEISEGQMLQLRRTREK